MKLVKIDTYNTFDAESYLIEEMYINTDKIVAVHVTRKNDYIENNMGLEHFLLEYQQGDRVCTYSVVGTAEAFVKRINKD